MLQVKIVKIGLSLMIPFFSPCSGLVVSGYSQQKTVEIFDKSFSLAINPYKQFKNMYIVDSTKEEFKGIKGNSIFL